MTTAIVASLQKIAEGREAEVFAWEPGVVLKLYRGQQWAKSPGIELAAMTAVRAAVGGVPRAIEVVEVDGRPGLLMERVDGIDMLTQLGKQPWRIATAGDTLGRVHAALNTAKAPDVLEAQKDRLRRHLADVGTVRADLAERGMEALSRLPDGDRLCHGDYHPANIIVAAQGPMVIDWPIATRGDAAADVARSLLILRMGELPPGSSALLRTLAKVGRKVLLWRYTASYMRASSISRESIDRWTLPLAIVRLSEGIVEERPRLLKFIDTL